jgi:hypothetical protein
MDVDIAIGQPLAPFFNHAQQLMDTAAARQQSGSFMAMFGEAKTTPWMFNKTEPIFHTGVIFLDRQYSKTCLDTWRTAFDMGNNILDQKALYEMILYEEKTLMGQCSVVTMDSIFFMMPTEDLTRRGISKVFVHRTGNRESKMNKMLQYQLYRCTLMLDEEVVASSYLSGG